MPPSSTPTWTKYLETLEATFELDAGAAERRLDESEQLLGIHLPTQLRELLLEFDGLTDEYGDRFIWPIDEIVLKNREFRSFEGFRDLYMPFDSLLFFGTDGSGDQFAFAIHADGAIHRSDVFRWEHESDSRTWYARDMEQFLHARLATEVD